MLVLVHPYGLNSPGGGSRIFRTILSDSEQSWISVCSSAQRPPSPPVGAEVHYPLRPSFGRIETSRFGKYLYFLEKQIKGHFEEKLLNLCQDHGATAIHGVAHTLDFWYAYRVAQRIGLPYYLTVHDDLQYALKGRPELKVGMSNLPEVWEKASHRFVISHVMGEEYCRRYGRQPYTIVTDGISQFESIPLSRPEKSLRLYFMGAVHLNYEQNFRSLYGALQLLKGEYPDWAISLTIRGGCPFQFDKTSVPVNFLPWASEAEVHRDLAQADYLYLPLPLDPKFESFVKFSLSTKMVTYLGSGLPIIYHGPQQAAASALLSDAQAAIICNSSQENDIRMTLRQAPLIRENVINNALKLGKNSFTIEQVRRSFWSSIGEEKPLCTL
jgi:glycosyltransferase involved in cell wall biosynthesis